MKRIRSIIVAVVALIALVATASTSLPVYGTGAGRSGRTSVDDKTSVYTYAPAIGENTHGAVVSRYASTLDLNAYETLGCRAGERAQAGFIALFFGHPAYQNGVYKVDTYGPPPNDVKDLNWVRDAAKKYLDGYWGCSPDWAGAPGYPPPSMTLGPWQSAQTTRVMAICHFHLAIGMNTDDNGP